MRRTDTQSGGTKQSASPGRKVLSGILILVGVVVVAYVVLTAIIAFGFAMERSAAGSAHVDVSMTEGNWTIDPVSLESAGTIDFTFANNGSTTHRPIVVSVRVPADELEARLREGDTAAILDQLFRAPVDGGPQVEHGMAGHFHPGSAEQSELPDDAVVRDPGRGDISRYIYTDAVAAGERNGGSASNIEKFEPGMSFVVLCLDPEHAGRGEYAVLNVAQGEQ